MLSRTFAAAGQGASTVNIGKLWDGVRKFATKVPKLPVPPGLLEYFQEEASRYYAKKRPMDGVLPGNVSVLESKQASDVIRRHAKTNAATAAFLEEVEHHANFTPVFQLDSGEVLSPDDPRIQVSLMTGTLGTLPGRLAVRYDGTLCTHIFTEQSRKDMVTSPRSYEKELIWHSDQAGTDPDYDSLNGMLIPIRNDEKVPTRFLTVDDIVAHLDPKTIETLKTRDFYMPDMHGYPGGVVFSHPILFRTKEGRWAMFFTQNPNQLQGLDATARKAIHKVNEAIKACVAEELVISAEQDPGTATIWSELTTLHSREIFEPKSLTPEERRHLIRTHRDSEEYLIPKY